MDVKQEQHILKELHVLSEKMDRYEAHRLELKKDIEAVSSRQSEIVTLLAGSDLNNKKGFFSLIDKLDEKIDLISESIITMKKDIDNTKFWGRTATGVLVALVLVIINAIKDKL